MKSSTMSLMVSRLQLTAMTIPRRTGLRLRRSAGALVLGSLLPCSPPPVNLESLTASRAHEFGGDTFQHARASCLRLGTVDALLSDGEVRRRGGDCLKRLPE